MHQQLGIGIDNNKECIIIIERSVEINIACASAQSSIEVESDLNLRGAIKACLYRMNVSDQSITEHSISSLAFESVLLHVFAQIAAF